jgi:hypothetical protein
MASFLLEIDMKNLLFTSLISFLIILSSCATTSVALLDESTNYPPTQSVQILTSNPNQRFKVIAHLETKGSAGQSLPELLESMREKAKTIGADAIIPTEEGIEKVQQGIIYNPWLGGYQTIGGGNFPILRGYAIVFFDKAKSYHSSYHPSAVKDYSFGIGVNFAPMFFGGFGGGVWFGVKKLRFNFEYFKNDIPSSFFRDDFENGKVENAFRFGVDYFFMKNLSGIYFPVGFESWKNSVGHKYSDSRGEYEMLYLSVGIGYLLKINENIYFDSRFSIGGSLSQPGEVDVGGYSFLPDKASYSGFIGLGVNF